MAILNGDLDWRVFESNEKLRGAFRGIPAKTRIDPGAVLCRFITTETGKKRYRDSGIYSSPWWLDWSTTASMLDRWKRARVAPRDVIRGRLAVTRQFSPRLDSMVQIILTRPVYAWKGIARHQEDKASAVTYLGGGEQLFLPNLVSDPGSLSSAVAILHCYCSVDALV
jgi:hypothetical protein